MVNHSPTLFIIQPFKKGDKLVFSISILPIDFTEICNGFLNLKKEYINLLKLYNSNLNFINEQNEYNKN